MELPLAVGGSLLLVARVALFVLVALLSLGGQTIAWTGVGLGSIPCMRV